MSVENTEGNTGPMRPAKGNSPGEAELSNGPTECGETAAGAAEPSPRGTNAPLEKLTVTTAFPRRSSGDGRGPRWRDGRTAGRRDVGAAGRRGGGTAGRRDGGTAGRRSDRAAGRRDGGTTGRQGGGTVGWRDGGTATHRDGGTERTAAVEWRRRQRVEKHEGRWAVEWKGRTWVSVAGREVRRL